MDFDSDPAGRNIAWLVAGGVLFTVDLASGRAAQVGTIKGLNGKLLDIAIWK